MKKILNVAAISYAVVGIALLVGGAWGASYTCKGIAREKIVTTDDAAIPGKPVRGPLTVLAQADVIRKHTLEITGGMTYAEMPREIPKLDEARNPVLDPSGKPVMEPNRARDIWVTATTLMTALDLAILAYALSALAIVGGLVLIGTAVLLRAIAVREDRKRS